MPAGTKGDAPRAGDVGLRSLAPGSPARTVLDFRVERPEESFVPAELRDGTGVDDDRIEPVLEWLAGMGVAERDGRRWTVGPDDRLAVLAGMYHSFRAIDGRYPPPDKEKWNEYAEQPPD